MELYILPISGEQICNAKHWIQDATHGYKEAIRTKLIKQDPGLRTAHRILSRNQDISARETNRTPSHAAARSSLPCTTAAAENSSNKLPTQEIPAARSLYLRYTWTEVSGCWAACFITGKPGAAMPWSTQPNVTALVAKTSNSDLQYPRSEDKLDYQPSLSGNPRDITSHPVTMILSPRPVWLKHNWIPYRRNPDRCPGQT